MNHEFLVTHIFAAIWLTGHFVLATGLALVYYGQWTWFAIWVGILVLHAKLTYEKSDKVINFFQPVFKTGLNGITILGNSQPRQACYLYCFHPHGIVANGFGVSMHAILEKRPERKITVAVAKSLLWFNLAFRWFVNSYGCALTSVSSGDLRRAMASRTADLAMCPGGFEEVMLMEKGKDVVYLNHRKGFIKLAMEYGYEIVPIFAFGESDFYSNAIPLPKVLRGKLARWGVPIVIPQGRSWWNFMPNKPANGLVVAFGNPILTNCGHYPGA